MDWAGFGAFVTRGLQLWGSRLAWTLVIGLLGVALSIRFAPAVAARLGWRRRATLVCALLVSGVLALTMGPGGAVNPGGVRACVRRTETQVGTLFSGVPASAEALLNLVFLFPLGVALVLATRRVWLPILLVLLLPGAIELVQTQLPGRVCSAVDYFTNVTGGVAGTLVGGLVLLVGWLLRLTRGGVRRR